MGAGLGAWRARFAVVLVVAGCGRAGSEHGVSEVSAAIPGAVAPSDPRPDAALATMADGESAGARSDVAAAEAFAETREAVLADGVEAGFDAYLLRDDVPETVSLERCQAACNNAKRVTLGELSPDIALSMREAIEHAMTRECPHRCVARASVSAVRCIESARTALELAGCPR